MADELVEEKASKNNDKGGQDGDKTESAAERAASNAAGASSRLHEEVSGDMASATIIKEQIGSGTVKDGNGNTSIRDQSDQKGPMENPMAARVKQLDIPDIWRRGADNKAGSTKSLKETLGGALDSSAGSGKSLAEQLGADAAGAKTNTGKSVKDLIEGASKDASPNAIPQIIHSMDGTKDGSTERKDAEDKSPDSGREKGDSTDPKVIAEHIVDAIKNGGSMEQAERELKELIKQNWDQNDPHGSETRIREKVAEIIKQMYGNNTGLKTENGNPYDVFISLSGFGGENGQGKFDIVKMWNDRDLSKLTLADKPLPEGVRQLWNERNDNNTYVQSLIGGPRTVPLARPARRS